MAIQSSCMKHRREGPDRGWLVQVRIDAQVARCPLNHRHSPCLGPAKSRSPRVERGHRVDEDVAERAEKRSVLGKPSPPRERERQNLLPQRHRGRQHALDEIRCRSNLMIAVSVRRGRSGVEAARAAITGRDSGGRVGPRRSVEAEPVHVHAP